MKFNRSIGIVSTLVLLMGLLFAMAGPASATDGDEPQPCVPSDAWTETVQHDAVTHVVHHDAVTHTVHHEATTEVVHHDAVTHEEYHFAKFTHTKTRTYIKAVQGTPDLWWNFSPNRNQGPLQSEPAFPNDARGTWEGPHSNGGPEDDTYGTFSTSDHGNASWFHRNAGTPAVAAHWSDWSAYGPWTKWSPETHTSWELSTTPLGSPQFHGQGADWYREWQAQFDGQTSTIEDEAAYDETVTTHEAYDETVVDHAAYDETVVDSAAWTETVEHDAVVCTAPVTDQRTRTLNSTPNCNSQFVTTRDQESTREGVLDIGTQVTTWGAWTPWETVASSVSTVHLDKCFVTSKAHTKVHVTDKCNCYRDHVKMFSNHGKVKVVKSHPSRLVWKFIVTGKKITRGNGVEVQYVLPNRIGGSSGWDVKQVYKVHTTNKPCPCKVRGDCQEVHPNFVPPVTPCRATKNGHC